MALQRNKTLQELRKFAAVMTVVLGSIAFYLGVRGRGEAAVVVGVLAAFFSLGGLFWPRLLEPIKRRWLALGEAIGQIMTPVILTLAYLLIVTPFGFLVRLLGKDLLELKIDKTGESYWKQVEKKGPGTRPFLPY